MHTSTRAPQIYSYIPQSLYISLPKQHIFTHLCIRAHAQHCQQLTAGATLLRLTVTRLSMSPLATHSLTTAHGPLSIAPKQYPCSTFSVQTRGEGRPCYQQMLSIAIANCLDCRSLTLVNNAGSETRGGGGQRADEPPKARAATRASERREKGERMEDEWSTRRSGSPILSTTCHQTGVKTLLLR